MQNSPGTNRAAYPSDELATDAMPSFATSRTLSPSSKFPIRDSNIRDIRTSYTSRRDGICGVNPDWTGFWDAQRSRRCRTPLPSAASSTRCSGWSASNELIRLTVIRSVGPHRVFFVNWDSWKLKWFNYSKCLKSELVWISDSQKLVFKN